LGKLEAPDDLVAALEANGFRSLPIQVTHALLAGSLPRIHDDPFDRMLVAQAKAEGLTLVTADTRLADYAVSVIRA
jgi:PIN domain nuclease of toxin-antitoxin system